MLSFCSSELTSHAANILGLSVILFAFLNVSIQIFERVAFPNIASLGSIQFKSYFDYLTLFLVFLILISGIIFSALRLVYYGRYAHRIILQDDPEGEICSINKLRLAIMDEVHVGKFALVPNIGKIKIGKFVYVPVYWFAAGISENTPGIKYSFFLGGPISLLLFYLLFFNNFSLLMAIIFVLSILLLIGYFWRAGGFDFGKTFLMKCSKCGYENKLFSGEVKIRNIILCGNCKNDITKEIKEELLRKGI